ncbi:MAG: PAS domain S-box protein [Opitutaceae bacterium]|nr:PAS domain S-box protein [Opitutaceae bacterium]
MLVDNYPFSFRGPDGRMQGFAYELLQEIERVMDLRFERVEGTTDDINRAFREGRLDLLQSYARSPERATQAEFSVPYLNMAGQVFVRRGGPEIKALADLRGRKVLVHRGSVGEQVLQQAGLGETITHVDSVEQALVMVDRGEGDATLAARLTGLAVAHQRGLTQLRVAGVEVEGYAVAYCIAVQKGAHPLLARINEGMALLGRNGRFDELYRKWFGFVAPVGYTAEQVLLVVAGGLTLALGIALWGILRQRTLLKRIAGQAETLREREERLSMIIQNEPECVKIVDRGGGLVEMNPAGLAMLEAGSLAEVQRKSLLEFVAPEHRAAFRSLHGRVMAGGDGTLEFEVVGLKNGRRWLDTHAAPLRDAEGRVTALLGITRDITERKRMEQAARASEVANAAILASALDCIIAMDRHGRVIEWNPAAERTFGYSRADAMGQPLGDLIVPVRLREAHGRGLARFLEKGEGPVVGRRIEMPALHRDGKEFPVELSIVVSRADDLFFTAYLRDITERQHMELAVRESEARFRTMANSIPQLAWTARADGFIFWYNQRWHDYTGTTPEQMEGWGWQSVHDPAVLPKVVANWTDAIASGKRFDMEFPLRGADGQFRTFLTRVEPLKDSAGRVVQWFGTNTDVEALKQAQERLRQSEEFNRRIIESSPDCIKVLDLEARLLSMSEGGQRLMEIHDLNRYLNNSWISFWQPGDQPRVRDGIEAAKAGGAGRFQAFCLTETGNPRWWDVIITPIRGASGQVERLLSISRDISERYQAEEKIRRLNSELEQRVVERTAQLEAANRQLEVTNKELEAFSYSVSHDLRAPLRAVDGFAQIVIEDYGPQLPAEGRRHLENIGRGARKMGALIDDLLRFSRLGRLPLSKRPVNTTQLVDEALEELAGQRAGRSIEIKRDPLPPCSGDPALLRQVWINLLSNAVKYTAGRNPAVVEIGCRRQGGEDVFFVRDNGAGFDMQYAGKLFGVFQRQHRAEDYEGTGVGLAIVQRVIHRHGGRVWAEAAVDRGATFYFTLGEETASSSLS